MEKPFTCQISSLLRAVEGIITDWFGDETSTTLQSRRTATFD
jgi:hypothetical protein